MASTNKNVYLVTAMEQDKIARVLLYWLNEYPDLPASINYEFLASGTPSMALSSIQGAFKTKRYISGGYEAQYQFKIIYRVQPGVSNDSRLNADETLDAVADWACSRDDLPDLGVGVSCLRIETNARSSLFSRYENGDEDHQILMTMTYEVI